MPGPRDQPSDCGKELRVPVKKGIENIDDDVAEGATIIDGRLSALRAVAPGQWCAAIFAVRQGRSCPPFSPERSAFSIRTLGHSRNRGISEDEFRRLVGHGPSLGNRSARVHA